jgi:hypothetical protein
MSAFAAAPPQTVGLTERLAAIAESEPLLPRSFILIHAMDARRIVSAASIIL